MALPSLCFSVFPKVRSYWTSFEVLFSSFWLPSSFSVQSFIFFPAFRLLDFLPTRIQLFQLFPDFCLTAPTSGCRQVFLSKTLFLSQLFVCWIFSQLEFSCFSFFQIYTWRLPFFFLSIFVSQFWSVIPSPFSSRSRGSFLEFYTSPFPVSLSSSLRCDFSPALDGKLLGC